MSKARSIPEIADWFTCRPKFLRDEIARGNLTARKIGRHFIRVLPSDLKAWLDSGITVASKEVA